MTHDVDDTIERDISIGQAIRRLTPLLNEHRGRLFVGLLLMLAATGLALYWPILLQQTIDGPLTELVGNALAPGAMNALLVAAGLILLFMLLSMVATYLQRVQLEIIGQDLMLTLKRQLFHHILKLDVAWFDRNPVGRLLARVESDSESLRLMFTNTVVLLIGDLLLVIGIYGIMAWTSPALAGILFLSMPLSAILVYVYHKVTSHRYLAVRKRTSTLTGTLTEFLHGMSIIQIFHRGRYARSAVQEANQAKFNEDRFVHIAATLFFNVLFLFEYIKIAILLYLGFRFGLTPGQIVLFLILIMKSFEPIFRVSEQLGNVQKGLAGARRIYSLLGTQPRVTDPIKPVVWPGLNDAIRFEDVSFSYTDDDNFALKNATFEIPRGKRVALVGVTGGGKTTVISLLLRFYDPQKGRITVDGVDLRTMTREDLRDHMALVLQDIILFPGSVAENISLGSETITEEQIRRAADTVAAGSFIERLPEGYATAISEKGSNFSRGERQLLSFARALAFNPDLLILDEATSSVDPETERSIQAALKKLMAGRTSLIIAHRLSTILDVDQILVLRNGEIIERGSHVDLMLQDGYYARLFHLQFKPRKGDLANV